jgi:hypothetical protein
MPKKSPYRPLYFEIKMACGKSQSIIHREMI